MTTSTIVASCQLRQSKLQVRQLVDVRLTTSAFASCHRGSVQRFSTSPGAAQVINIWFKHTDIKAGDFQHWRLFLQPPDSSHRCGFFQFDYNTERFCINTKARVLELPRLSLRVLLLHNKPRLRDGASPTRTKPKTILTRRPIFAVRTVPRRFNP